jgi:Ice-binding-like
MSMTPTRLFNGVGTEKITNPLGMYPLPNKCTGKISVYDNDFLTYSAGDWTETVGQAAGALGTAASGFVILAATAITTTGTQVVTGDVGEFPGTAVTGLDASQVSGTLHITDGAASAAQTAALATYTALSIPATTVIASALDGQTLQPGYYSFASGAATLATSAPGTLTLNGSATDQIVIKTASTLTTGAGGAPTITLTGGLLASNVYWIVGSSATINSGTAGTFRGNIIAYTSITDTMGGTVNGRLFALNGAVTLSAATTISAPAAAASGKAGLVAGGGLWGWLGMTASYGVGSLVGYNAFNFTPATASVNGLQTWFEARVKLDATVANPDYILGLTKGPFSTTYADATDGVYFTKATGASLWSFNLKSAATGNTTTVTIPNTLPVNGATVDLAYYFDGKGMFFIYFNKVCVATYGNNPSSLSGSLGSLLTNLPGPTVLLAPTLGNAYHTAPATLLVDCILAAVDTTRNA